MNKICCVYKLTNTVTGKFYIGSTLNFYARMKYHHYSHDRNPNKELGADINTDGIHLELKFWKNAPKKMYVPVSVFTLNCLTPLRMGTTLLRQQHIKI